VRISRGPSKASQKLQNGGAASVCDSWLTGKLAPALKQRPVRAIRWLLAVNSVPWAFAEAT
jgi:hypothetical protein